MATKTLDKDQILEAIDTMSVLELSELVKAFEERYGVTAAAPVAVAAAGAPAAGGDGAAAAATEEQTEFDAVLTDVGAEQDPRDQGRARADRPWPQGGEGPRRRRPEGRAARASPRRRPRRSRRSSPRRARPSRSSSRPSFATRAGPVRAGFVDARDGHGRFG